MSGGAELFIYPEVIGPLLAGLVSFPIWVVVGQVAVRLVRPRTATILFLAWYAVSIIVPIVALKADELVLVVPTCTSSAVAATHLARRPTQSEETRH